MLIKQMFTMRVYLGLTVTQDVSGTLVLVWKAYEAIIPPKLVLFYTPSTFFIE